MRTTIKSINIASPGNISIKDIPYPVKKPHEALIQLESAGICGSDIGAYRGTNPLITYPRTLGHEIAGRVLEIGEGIHPEISVGDRVIVDPYVYCGHCYPCNIGRTNCCENLNVIGVHIDGGMQEVLAHPAKLLHRVPDNLPIESIPLAEPLTISLHALHRAKLTKGEHVVIIGAGAIGIMAALAAKEYHATPILVDIVDSRLFHARKVGIPHTINCTSEDAQQRIKEITQGRMAEVVIEASGATESIKSMLDYVSFAGRISLTGWPKSEIPLRTNLITFKELDIRGSRTSAGEFNEALSLLASGKIKHHDIISKVVNFDEIPEMIKDISDHPEKHLKINAILSS